MSHIDAMKQALEYLQDNQHLIADNERHAYVMEYNAFIERFEQAIAEAEKQQALDKMADNARELGLSYEVPAVKTYCGGKPNYCIPEQPALAQEPVACKECGAAIKNGKVKCVRGRNCWVGRQPAPAQPLSENEIQKLRHNIDWTAIWSYINFARAIEAAHGITKGTP